MERLNYNYEKKRGFTRQPFIDDEAHTGENITVVLTSTNIRLVALHKG